jgi:TatA/E family protein of Tat protein translocase
VLDLSPTKLLIIFIVVVVLLGPKRLPEVARQLGAGWRKLRDLHGRFDRELRQTMPDLPTSQDIVRFARSPITLLEQLADRHDDPPTQDRAGVASDGGASDGGASDGGASDGGASDWAAPHGVTLNGAVPDDDGRARSKIPGAPGWAGKAGGPAVGVHSLAGLDADDPNLN